MFRSAETLRHEAAQRSLDRVAHTWRSERATWFDGTPESIAARLASTDRVLTVARSGFSPAHLALAVEADNARKELLAAQHRLLVDFLDDGARAFKGSKREAGPVRCPECGKTLRDSIDRLNHAHGEDGEVYDGGPQYGYENREDFYNRTRNASHRTAATIPDFDDALLY